MTEFSKLGLKKNILEGLAKLKLKEAFEVQEKIIPQVLQGKNLVFTAMTGSGKTLAYLLGFLGKINVKQGVQMLIIVPTRELAIQVGKETKKLCEPLGIKTGVFYGGREIIGDYKTLQKKNQIIIGTPGRVVQHINNKRIMVGDIKFLVFDESDQMFDDGFYKQCSYVKHRVSKDVQVILASATITGKVEHFCNKEIVEYDFLKVGKQIPNKIVQEKMYCQITEKNQILLDKLNKKKFKRALVFCNTKIKSREVEEFLTENKIKSKVLNSSLTQEERVQYLNLFKEGKIKILVTTDIAARGLHISDVDIVINYDVPPRDEFYIHRIGRTGRKNKKGYSLTLICPEDDDKFANIEFDYELKVIEIN